MFNDLLDLVAGSLRTIDCCSDTSEERMTVASRMMMMMMMMMRMMMMMMMVMMIPCNPAPLWLSKTLRFSLGWRLPIVYLGGGLRRGGGVVSNSGITTRMLPFRVFCGLLAFTRSQLC